MQDLNQLFTKIRISFSIICFTFILSLHSVEAYPIFAQQGYENPREATGRIVCANCHLAQKNVSIEVPQAIFPGQVFDAMVKIPFDPRIKQVQADGNKGGLNIGAVLILPQGFEIFNDPNKEQQTIFQPYNNDKKNIIVVGPIDGSDSYELDFPIKAPENESYLKYPIYLGGNRGRGQIYPNGNKSNNSFYTSSIDGSIEQIYKSEKGTREIIIKDINGEKIVELIPPGPRLIITKNQSVKKDQPLTNNPNVGGFGQADTEIVLQDPNRLYGLIIFATFIIFAQLFLVLKKKQFEKCQLADLNF